MLLIFFKLGFPFAVSFNELIKSLTCPLCIFYMIHVLTFFKIDFDNHNLTVYSGDLPRHHQRQNYFQKGDEIDGSDLTALIPSPVS